MCKAGLAVLVPVALRCRHISALAWRTGVLGSCWSTFWNGLLEVEPSHYFLDLILAQDCGKPSGEVGEGGAQGGVHAVLEHQVEAAGKEVDEGGYHLSSGKDVRLETPPGSKCNISKRHPLPNQPGARSEEGVPCGEEA